LFFLAFFLLYPIFYLPENLNVSFGLPENIGEKMSLNKKIKKKSFG